MRFDNGETALVVFSFTSLLAADLPPAAVHRICREAQRFNVSRGLTGDLQFDGRRVRQVVEGSWAEVMPLAARILTDPRHGAIAITAFEPIASRSQDDWTWSGPALDIAEVSLSDNLRLLPFVRRPAPVAAAVTEPLGAVTTAS